MADYSRFKALIAEREDKVLVLTLNRPDRLNAVDPPMHAELEEFFAQLATDKEVNAVVITGAGRAFCAGGDVKGMAARTGSRMENALADGAGARRLLSRLIEIQQPIIAAVNGDAIGLGATIALFCDVVIAAENARFADPHVKVGLVAGDGGAIIWPLLVGVNRAKELLITGDLVPAREAERIGLVNHVVPIEELLPRAKELAHRLANGPILAIKWTKASVNKLVRERLNNILSTSVALEELSMLTEDHKEASTAFAEKRPPKFVGR